MSITDHEASTLLAVLDAVTAGTITPYHRATAGALADRFRRGDERFKPEGAAPEPVRIDANEIYAARRKVVEEANAARMAHLPQLGGTR